MASVEQADDVDLVETAPSNLVLVTGAGRSGTSTVAGALNHLGLHVPPPVLGGNRTNPRGFFEPRWVIEFHKQMLERARIHEFDANPAAFARAEKALTPAAAAELRGWLAEAAGQAPQLVVKDPRTVFARDLWVRTATDLGMTPHCLTMLRHPAEVIGSRSTYYAAKATDERARAYEVAKLAGWVNVSLLNERISRGESRVFVRYEDLLADWRTAMTAVRDDLGLVFNADPASGERHRVDDFVDSDLRRVRVTWDDLDVPAELRVLAEETWSAYEVLADRHGCDRGAQEALDQIGERYESLHRDAVAVAHDATATATRTARVRAAKDTRAELKQAATKTGAGRAGGIAPRLGSITPARLAAAIRRRVLPR